MIHKNLFIKRKVVNWEYRAVNRPPSVKKLQGSYHPSNLKPCISKQMAQKTHLPPWVYVVFGIYIGASVGISLGELIDN